MEFAALWSAVTCHRFGITRPVAASAGYVPADHRRQAASDQSGDRSPHSKEFAGLDQSFLKFVGQFT